MNVPKPESRDGDFFRCGDHVHTDLRSLVTLVKGKEDMHLQHRVEMFFMHGFELNKGFTKKSDRKKVTLLSDNKEFTFESVGKLGRLDHPEHNKFLNQMHFE